MNPKKKLFLLVLRSPMLATNALKESANQLTENMSSLEHFELTHDTYLIFCDETLESLSKRLFKDVAKGTPVVLSLVGDAVSPE